MISLESPEVSQAMINLQNLSPARTHSASISQSHRLSFTTSALKFCKPSSRRPISATTPGLITSSWRPTHSAFGAWTSCYITRSKPSAPGHTAFSICLLRRSRTTLKAQAWVTQDSGVAKRSLRSFPLRITPMSSIGSSAPTRCKRSKVRTKSVRKT
ncbi:hypothetical protein D3C76_978160 [compost metagenome]